MPYNPFVRGPHPVGVRTIALSDESRESRRVEVELWYPASSRYRGLDRDEATCDRFTIAPGLGGRQQAVREAQVTDGRFPMVLYSHAAASHRRDAALMGPHWHGTDTLQSLCLAHMDAHLKDMPEAHTFLDHDIAARFAARGIGLDVVAADRAVTV